MGRLLLSRLVVFIFALILILPLLGEVTALQVSAHSATPAASSTNSAQTTGTGLGSKNQKSQTSTAKATPSDQFEAAQTTQTVQVDATQGWQDTGISLQSGETFMVSYISGTWSIDPKNYPYVGPGGESTEVPDCLYDSGYPAGYLLGTIGDVTLFSDNVTTAPGSDFGVGTGGTFTASQSGELYFRINDADNCLGDNAGSVTMIVQTGYSQSATCVSPTVTLNPSETSESTSSFTASGSGWGPGGTIIVTSNPAGNFTPTTADANGSWQYVVQGIQSSTSATFSYTFSESDEACTASVTQNYTINLPPPPPANVSLSGGNVSMIVGGQANLTATVTDANGNPVSGADVSFTVSGPNSTGIDAGLTNRNGQASLTYTGTNSGTDTITATAGGVTSAPETIQWSNAQSTTGPSNPCLASSGAQLAAVPVNAGPLVTGTTPTFVATLKDASGNPIPNVSIDMIITGANPTDAGSGDLPGFTIPTDANGQASIQDYQDNADTGTSNILFLADCNNSWKTDSNGPFLTLTVTWTSRRANCSGSHCMSPAAKQNARDDADEILVTEALGKIPGGIGDYVACYFFNAASDNATKGLVSGLECISKSAVEGKVKFLEDLDGDVDKARLVSDMAIYDDPPDSNYKELATPNLASITYLTAASGLPVSVVNAANDYAKAGIERAAVMAAMVTSYERAQGAAAAGDSHWESLQAAKAQAYAAQLSQIMAEEQAKGSNLVTTLSSSTEGISASIQAPSNQQLESALNTINAHGLPSDLTTSLTAAGLTADSIAAIQSGFQQGTSIFQSQGLTFAQSIYPQVLTNPAAPISQVQEVL